MNEEALSPEEFVKKWGLSPDGQMAIDLNALLRKELICFCRKNVPAELIGDEVILVDEYFKSRQQ